MKIIVKNVRLSFPQLFEPQAVMKNGKPEGEPAYSASFLLPPDHPQMDQITKVIEDVVIAKWKDEAQTVFETLKAQDRICVHNGNHKRKRDGYAGMLYISARSYVAPQVTGRDPYVRDEAGKPVVDPSTGKIVMNLLKKGNRVVYSGCYGHAVLDIYAQDNQYGQRVNATLLGFQFFKDGDAFAGGQPADESDFEDLSVADAPPAQAPKGNVADINQARQVPGVKDNAAPVETVPASTKPGKFKLASLI